MTKKEAVKILSRDLNLINELSAKEKQIEDYLEHSTKVFQECNYLFSACTNYLSASADSRRHAPIPAWRGWMPSVIEAKSAFETLTQLMKESQPLLIDTTHLRDQYHLYCRHFGDYLSQAHDLFKKLNQKEPDAAAIKTISAQIDTMPSYVSQINTMLNTVANYKLRMQSIEQKISVLKNVN